MALVWGLAGCSTVKFAYNQSPELAYWYLNSYLDFTSTQSAPVREALTQLQQWHRRTQLRTYADLLQKVEQVAPDALTPGQVCAVYDELREKISTVSDQLAPMASGVVIGFELAQVRHLEDHYANKNAEWRKDWMDASPQAQRTKRLAQIQDRFEMLYGRLTDEQKALLQASIAKSRFDAKISYAEYLRRQQDAVQTLQKIVTDKPPPAQAQTLVQDYLNRAITSPDPVYRSYQAALTQDSCASFAQLHNSTSTAQREAAVKRLQGYERDLRELAAAR